MFLVGLTGGIGSGKSTVSRLLVERGATVVDADLIAREVVDPGTDGFDAVVARFGDGVVRDGRLDREALGRIVFADEDARADLNAIVHPRVGERIAARLAEAEGIVVLDVPLLVEAAQERPYQAVVVVTAPEEVRVRRLVADRGMDAADARARIATQASDEERVAVATHVIDNSGDLATLEDQVERLWDELATAAAAADDDAAGSVDGVPATDAETARAVGGRSGAAAAGEVGG